MIKHTQTIHLLLPTNCLSVFDQGLTYRPLSKVASGDLQIPLQLTFRCDRKETLDIMNVSKDSLYDWGYSGLVDDKEDEKSSDKGDEDFVINAKDDGCDDVIVLDCHCIFLLLLLFVEI